MVWRQNPKEAIRSLLPGPIVTDINPDFRRTLALSNTDFFVFFQITTYRSGVGTQGSKQTLFYAQVRDEDRTSAGGGNESEGEFIQVRAKYIF